MGTFRLSFGPAFASFLPYHISCPGLQGALCSPEHIPTPTPNPNPNPSMGTFRLSFGSAVLQPALPYVGRRPPGGPFVAHPVGARLELEVGFPVRTEVVLKPQARDLSQWENRKSTY